MISSHLVDIVQGVAKPVFRGVENLAHLFLLANWYQPKEACEKEHQSWQEEGALASPPLTSCWS